MIKTPWEVLASYKPIHSYYVYVEPTHTYENAPLDLDTLLTGSSDPGVVEEEGLK